MVRVSDGGGGEEGIDPSVLQSMISTMKSSTGNAATLVDSYKSQFSRYGLDTTNLTKAAQDLSWAQDQVPMLSRRQSLAQAAANQTPGLTVTDVGAGPLDFPTDAAAQAAGQADGANALNALTDRSDNQFILKDLQAHQDDPAYLAAFFQALGPHGLTALGLQVTGYQQSGDTSKYQDWAAAVGGSFAVASYRMPYKSDWIGQLQLPDDLLADPSMPQLSLIQPFLEHGVYSPAWLEPLGTYAVQQAFLQQQPGPAVLPVDLDGIWTALANNPAFDARFYQQNFKNDSNPPESLRGIMSSMYGISVADSAFASMVRSATIAPAMAVGSQPYALNAQRTVEFFGGDPSLRTSGAVRAVFGTIAATYFDDLAATVRAAAPGIGGQDVPGLQVSAPQEDWAAFVQEAMRDKTTSAQLLAFYGLWAHGQPDDSWPSEGGGPNVPLNQGFWNDVSLGMLRDFMAHNYQVAGAPAGGTDTIKEIAFAGGAAFLTSLVFPEGGLAIALAEGGKDAFQTAAEQGLTSVFGSGEPQPSNPEALTKLTGIQTNWSQIVSDWYDAGNRATLTTYMKQPYSGDPATYISQFSAAGQNANFIQHGQIMDPDAMNPYQLAAYNAWLQDPAIVLANRGEFFVKGYGGLLSQYARGYSGGG
jgi:hypothetical protein